MRHISKFQFRRFSNSPKPLEDYKEKEQAALQEVKDEKLEDSKRQWDLWFPEQKKIEIKREIPTYISKFGPSDEEDTAAFFLSDLSTYQYIYTPKSALEFDINGFSLVYQAPSRSIFAPHKLRYCWKIIFPVLFSIGLTFQPIVHSNISIILSWCLPLLLLTQGLMVEKIFLNQDGKTVKFVYKRFKFLPLKEKVFDVSTFKEPSGDAFIFWSLYEFPDDLKTFNENAAVERIGFGKNINWWSFFVLPKGALQINREVLINVMNGIYIDTKELGGEDLKSRYFILEVKGK